MEKVFSRVMSGDVRDRTNDRRKTSANYIYCPPVQLMYSNDLLNMPREYRTTELFL